MEKSQLNFQISEIVKPSKLQYFFGQDWPTKIWIMVIPLLCAFAAAFSCQPTLALFSHWSDILMFVGVILLALLLGFFVSILLGLFVLGPLYYDRSIKNGEPFHEGDIVYILAGPHRGRIGRVYKVWDIASWAGAHRVRVELDEKGTNSGQDIFKSYQVFRTTIADQGAA
jgi:hypothetical protein